MRRGTAPPTIRTRAVERVDDSTAVDLGCLMSISTKYDLVRTHFYGDCPTHHLASRPNTTWSLPILRSFKRTGLTKWGLSPHTASSSNQTLPRNRLS